ncbi:hypothetical protein [Actinomadura algeriensis]|uniref:WD40 repeat domain-containing protein n=1 Tax=Actinomadura algeriensis TaxID=1679523 RepID=A0ABR9JJ24_9ACTN|nr:hypothetical protein [Actinomadura algeriensis]MBE1530555.1 hypothetical protein [Actinomadura algeriensis]
MGDRERASRWVAASGRGGPRGRWAGRRLLRAAERGGTDARAGAAAIARTPGHRLRDRAREALAAWWAATRDPDLRDAVVDSGAVAADDPARLVTLALHGRPADEWRDTDAGRAPVLLADPDPDVRKGIAAVCRTASGPVLRALWDADTGAGTPLRGVLLENGEPPPAAVLDGLWREWTDDPGAEPGDALLRWGRPATAGPLATLTAAVLEPDREALLTAHRPVLLTALDLGDHPLGEAAARKIADLADDGLIDDACTRAMDRPDVAALCERHGLVPRDAARRAAFLLVTGRTAQYRALDPDGGLLALAYAAAPDAVRARVRAALPAANDLDLVRVIVGNDRRARIGELEGGEARYLAERLADRREWDELWTFVQDLPLTQGVELIGLFDRWTPGDDDARRLFTAFREADSGAVASELRTLRADPLSMGRRTFQVDGAVTGLSFSPDGPFLAVATSGPAIDVLDPRSGRSVERFTGFDAPIGAVLHLGSGAVIAGERTDGGRACRLLRCADGRIETLRPDAGGVTSLAATGGGGFLAATRRGPLRGVPHGSWTALRPAAGPGPDPADVPRTIAAHPESGRFAVLGRTLRLLGPGLERALTTHPTAPLGGIAFVDADTLAGVTEQGAVTLLRASGDGPFVQDGFRWTARARVAGLRALGVLPDRGAPVVLDGTGTLRFLDGSTLRTRTRRPPPDGAAPAHLAVAPGGEFLAIADASGGVEVFPANSWKVAELLERPLAEAVPRDLEVLAAVPDEGGPLRLLAACLEHRFRRDVALGEAVRRSTGGASDVSL